MDERQKSILVKAQAIAGVFLMLCVVASLVYDIITTGDAGWELWALIGTALVMLISRRVMGDVEAPKDIFNRPLPTGNSKEDRRRRKIDYAVQSLLFAGVVAVMDVVLIGFGKDEVTDMELTKLLFPSLGHVTTVIVTAVIAFATMFVISYAAEYLVNECYVVKAYNRMLNELEDEDEA